MGEKNDQVPRHKKYKAFQIVGFSGRVPLTLIEANLASRL